MHDLKRFNFIDILGPRIWSLLANSLCVNENNISYFCWLGYLITDSGSNWLVVMSTSSISLLTCYLLILLIIGRKVLLSLVVTVEFAISFSGSLEFCFILSSVIRCINA